MSFGKYVHIPQLNNAEGVIAYQAKTRPFGLELALVGYISEKHSQICQNIFTTNQFTPALTSFSVKSKKFLRDYLADNLEQEVRMEKLNKKQDLIHEIETEAQYYIPMKKNELIKTKNGQIGFPVKHKNQDLLVATVESDNLSLEDREYQLPFVFLQKLNIDDVRLIKADEPVTSRQMIALAYSVSKLKPGLVQQYLKSDEPLKNQINANVRKKSTLDELVSSANVANSRQRF